MVATGQTLPPDATALCTSASDMRQSQDTVLKDLLQLDRMVANFEVKGTPIVEHRPAPREGLPHRHVVLFAGSGRAQT